MAVETIGPTPGIVISRRAVGSVFELWVISVSNVAICASNPVKVSTSTFRTLRTFRQGRSRILDEGDQGCDMVDALWEGVAIFK